MNVLIFVVRGQRFSEGQLSKITQDEQLQSEAVCVQLVLTFLNNLPQAKKCEIAYILTELLSSRQSRKLVL